MNQSRRMAKYMKESIVKRLNDIILTKLLKSLSSSCILLPFWIPSLLTNLPACSAFRIPFKKMLMNQSSEYWYIGSIIARSYVQKNRICVRTATGMYWLRVTSMSFSVCSATITFAWKFTKSKCISPLIGNADQSGSKYGVCLKWL